MTRVSMKFDRRVLDDIQARLPLSSVVRTRVQLRKQGDEWIGLSPFNREKTPSFYVNDSKGCYYCFSSGRSGDVFRFVMDVEGIPFSAAVRKLADQAGVTLPDPSENTSQLGQKRDRLLEVMELATDFYMQCYDQSGGDLARQYVKERGLLSETRQVFRIGYAPKERDALKNFLTSQGVESQLMLEAGLLAVSEDGISYDRFRHRLMFPIENASARVIAFGARALSKAASQKYLNSPDTVLFHKGHVLFNFHRARAAVSHEKSLLVVEGYFDAIIAYQSGLRFVVSTLGTAVTKEQILSLWGLAREPVICFDGDRAGVAAAHRIIDRALPLLRGGYSLSFAFLPDHYDPDKFISSFGIGELQEKVKQANFLSDLLLDRETSTAAIDTPERKAGLERRLENLIEVIQDESVKRAYKRKCRVRLSDLFWRHERQAGIEAVSIRGSDRVRGVAKSAAVSKSRRDASSFVGSESREQGIDHAAVTPKDDLSSIEKIVLGLVIEHPRLFHSEIERLTRLTFGNELHESFKQDLICLISDMNSDMDEELRSILYDKIDPNFHAFVDEIYGRHSLDREVDRQEDQEFRSGFRLRESFPILECSPPIDYLKECISHFLDRIELGQMERELRQDFESWKDHDHSSDISASIMALSSSIRRLRAVYDRQEYSLAEKAKLIKSVV